MSLTGIGDIPVLYEKVALLQRALEAQREDLQAQVSELQKIIFDGVILQEKDESWDIVRKKRDYLLKSTDWIMTPGSTIDQGAWASYRQIIRDLPQTFAATGPESVIWPPQPSTDGPNSTPVE